MAMRKGIGVIVPANDVKVVTQREVDGLEMGVLEDGTPFLSGRSLAKLCGVVPSAILGWLPGFDYASDKPRDAKLKALLAAQGHSSGALLVKSEHNGIVVNAHSDAVCMAVLEYYAFEAGAGVTEQAQNSFRALARRSLREFIYTSVGYDPGGVLPPQWRHYHDRLLLNPAPRGCFSVFVEVADVIVSAIRNGLVVDEHTVPDISVGLSWAKYWNDIDGDKKYGKRQKAPHVYPDYFPQAAAAQQIEAWVYPNAALGEFRNWMQESYLPHKYPRYIQTKVKAGALPPSRAELLLTAIVVVPKKIGN